MTENLISMTFIASAQMIYCPTGESSAARRRAQSPCTQSAACTVREVDRRSGVCPLADVHPPDVPRCGDSSSMCTQAGEKTLLSVKSPDRMLNGEQAQQNLHYSRTNHTLRSPRSWCSHVCRLRWRHSRHDLLTLSSPNDSYRCPRSVTKPRFFGTEQKNGVQAESKGSAVGATNRSAHRNGPLLFLPRSSA